MEVADMLSIIDAIYSTNVRYDTQIDDVSASIRPLRQPRCACVGSPSISCFATFELEIKDAGG